MAMRRRLIPGIRGKPGMAFHTGTARGKPLIRGEPAKAPPTARSRFAQGAPPPDG